MTPHQTRREADDIFGGIQSADALDAMEKAPVQGQQVAFFDGRVSRGLDPSLTDPRDTVECYVKPGRGGNLTPVVPEVGPDGLPTKLRVPIQVFESNRASLATRSEIARILANARTPRAHTVDREIQSRRQFDARAFEESLPPEVKARIDEKRRQYQDEDAAETRRGQEVAAAAAPPDARTAPAALPATEEALRDAIDEIRSNYAKAAAHILGEFGRTRLAEACNAETQELARATRESWAARKAAQAPAAPAPSSAGGGDIRARLEKLAELAEAHLITPEECAARRNSILAEV